MVALTPANPDAIALDVDGAEPADALHVTLMYLGDQPIDPADQGTLNTLIGGIAQRCPPITVTVNGIAEFNGGTPDAAVVLLVQGEGLRELRKCVDDACEAVGYEHDSEYGIWVPHLTVGYGIDPMEAEGLAGQTIVLDSLETAFGGDTPATKFPLEGDAMPTDEPAVKPVQQQPPQQAEAVEANFATEDGRWNGVLVVEGVPSGDGRLIEVGALTWRDLPLPLMAMFRNPNGGDGHDGAEIAGRIETIQREGDKILASGTFDSGTAGQELQRLMEEGTMRGVSVDLDSVMVEWEHEPPGADADLEDIFEFDPGMMIVTEARIMGATATGFPAFEEAHLEVIDGGTLGDEDLAVNPDDVSVGTRVVLGDRAGQVIAIAADPPVLVVMPDDGDTPELWSVDDTEVEPTEPAPAEGETPAPPAGEAPPMAENTADQTYTPVRSHSTGTNTDAWDGPANEARLPSPMSRTTAQNAYAWIDSNATGQELNKVDCRFIHHFVGANGRPGAASTVACSTGIGVIHGGRGGTTIPNADRKGVYDHLARHLRDAGMEPPPFQASELYGFDMIEEGEVEMEGEPALAASAGAPADRRPPLRMRMHTPVGRALVAAAGPVHPPAAWFERPKMRSVHPVRLSAEGQVFGYVCRWDDCHIGFSDRCVPPPHSPSAYSRFRTGQTLTAEGSLVATGRICCDTVHPDLRMIASDTMAFYADTGCVVADVAVYEDNIGVLVAGAARPNATDEQLRILRGSDISPDWRTFNGQLDMVGMLCVNTSGFVVEGMAASGGVRYTPTCAHVYGPRGRMNADGEMLALVAAGMIQRGRPTGMATQLLGRVAELEDEVATLRAMLKPERVARARQLLAAIQH